MKLNVNPSVTPRTAQANNRPDQTTNGTSESSLHSADEFAKIFESLGKGSEPQKQSNKPDTKEKTSTNEAQKSASEKHVQEDKKTNKDTSKQSNSDGDSKSDEKAVAAANAYGLAENRVNAPVEAATMPPARSILHIADLERIVSSIRVQNAEGQQQVTITLKNSVFEGLKVRLTTDTEQRVKAEFIASSEKVKEILDARGGELSEILKRRGIKLSELQTSVGADTSGRGNENERNADNFAPQKGGKSNRVGNVSNTLAEQVSDINENESGTSYRA